MFTKMHPMPAMIDAQTALMSAIAMASTTNIFKMSEPLAPSALKIPISPYLFLMLVEMKFENITMLKIAKTPATIKNNNDNLEKKSPFARIRAMAVFLQE